MSSDVAGPFVLSKRSIIACSICRHGCPSPTPASGAEAQHLKTILPKPSTSKSSDYDCWGSNMTFNQTSSRCLKASSRFGTSHVPSRPRCSATTNTAVGQTPISDTHPFFAFPRPNIQTNDAGPFFPGNRNTENTNRRRGFYRKRENVAQIPRWAHRTASLAHSSPAKIRIKLT